MNSISWRGIRAFILVAEHGSFTAAAEASGYSKANLSQQVTELESSLGVQLLYRTTRQLNLSEVGEGYFQRCKQAMLELDSAADWAGQAAGELKGVIRMNCVGGPIGEELLGPLVIEFQRLNPGVEIHLDFSSVFVDLIKSHYDLVIRMGDLQDSTLVARKLIDINTYYVASPVFLAEYGPINEPEDLTRLPLIYGSVDQWVLRRGEQQRTVHVSKGLKVISGRVMRQATLAGLGVTRVADIYVQPDLDAGRLVKVLPDWSEKTPLSMVCPPLRYQLNRVRALMDFLKAHFGLEYRRLLEAGAECSSVKGEETGRVSE